MRLHLYCESTSSQPGLPYGPAWHNRCEALIIGWSPMAGTCLWPILHAGASLFKLTIAMSQVPAGNSLAHITGDSHSHPTLQPRLQPQPQPEFLPRIRSRSSGSLMGAPYPTSGRSSHHGSEVRQVGDLHGETTDHTFDGGCEEPAGQRPGPVRDGTVIVKCSSSADSEEMAHGSADLVAALLGRLDRELADPAGPAPSQPRPTRRTGDIAADPLPALPSMASNAAAAVRTRHRSCRHVTGTRPEEPHG